MILLQLRLIKLLIQLLKLNNMFNIIDSIKDVKSFAINSFDDLLIAEQNLIYCYSNKKIFLNSETILQEIYSNDNYFYINDIFGKAYYINLNFELVSYDELILTIKSNYILSAKRIGETKNIYIKNLYDLNERYEILTSSTIYLIDSNKFYKKNFDLNLIEAYMFPSSKKLWQLELSNLGKFKTEFAGEKEYEVKQFVGVFKDILWVFLNSQQFIGLNIHSGTIIHLLKGVKKENFIGQTEVPVYDDTYLFYESNYILDDKTGKIIAIAIDLFYEIDLNNELPTIKSYGLLKQYKNKGFYNQGISNKLILIDNNLYFHNHNDLKFAIFDIDTKQIIYVSEKLTNDQTKRREIKDLQVANNKVYVLDSTGDLHIFEKEKLS